MKKSLVVRLVVAAGFATAFSAQAAEPDSGPWLVRLRGVNIDPDSSSEAGGPLNLPKNAIGADNRWAPEVDVSYFFTKNIALELIATYPQSQPVTLNVPGLYNGGIGSVKHLPPTLLVQYHFDWEGNPFKPYVGAGLNFTWFTQRDLFVPVAGGVPLEVDSTSWGPALQIGADYKLTRNWYLNVDFKYIWIDTQVKDTLTGGGLVNNKLYIDPMVYGAGVGYRF